MKYLHALGLAAALASPALVHAQAAPATPAAATPAVGATILDSAGTTIGTVDSVTPQAIVINTGTAKIAVPPASIGKTANGFSMAMTKAALDAAQAQQQAQAQAAVKAKLVAGTQVSGTDGALLGTIKAADTQTVTLTTAKGIDAKLPIGGFGAGPSGNVVLGMTAPQLAAATAGATPATPAAGATAAPAAAGASGDAMTADAGAAAPADQPAATATSSTKAAAAKKTKKRTTR